MQSLMLYISAVVTILCLHMPNIYRFLKSPLNVCLRLLLGDKSIEQQRKFSVLAYDNVMLVTEDLALCTFRYKEQAYPQRR
jgi:hypothetical protein